MKIVNEKKVATIYYHELPDDVKKDFDYASAVDSSFVNYRDSYYDISDFMRISEGAPEEMKGFDGYSSDSFFSGVLIKLTLPEDDPDHYSNDYVIMATYLS